MIQRLVRFDDPWYLSSMFLQIPALLNTSIAGVKILVRLSEHITLGRSIPIQSRHGIRSVKDYDRGLNDSNLLVSLQIPGILVI